MPLSVALKRGAIWNEVKDRLHAPGTGLVGRSQQRLCIANARGDRARSFLLMDEPCFPRWNPIANRASRELIGRTASGLFGRDCHTLHGSRPHG